MNDLILAALPRLANRNWQWLHLTGVRDVEQVKAVYATQGIVAIVKPFLAEMNLALGAATACVSRAGASSLAELAACRLPSLLVPFPAAADNHQFFNATSFANAGAAKLVEQKHATPENVAAWLTELVENGETRSQMRAALIPRHAPAAAAQIADHIMRAASRSEKTLVPAVEAPRAVDSAKAVI